ncbi:MAG TPA: VOC family protein [Thermoanaerobaculia bacterium]
MTAGSAASSRWNIAPYFLVRDVVETANWYRDRLGFRYERFWGEPPRFCMVWRRGVVIMLSQHENGAVQPNRTAVDGAPWDAYVGVDDADALLAEFAANGVIPVRSICDQEYGCRDFDVEDCNGYRLCFGQDLEG